jgi:hypothetical protein
MQTTTQMYWQAQLFNAGSSSRHTHIADLPPTCYHSGSPNEFRLQPTVLYRVHLRSCCNLDIFTLLYPTRPITAYILTHWFPGCASSSDVHNWRSSGCQNIKGTLTSIIHEDGQVSKAGKPQRRPTRPRSEGAWTRGWMTHQVRTTTYWLMRWSGRNWRQSVETCFQNLDCAWDED